MTDASSLVQLADLLRTLANLREQGLLLERIAGMAAVRATNCYSRKTLSFGSSCFSFRSSSLKTSPPER